jgi:hypothetical protein
MAEYHERDEWGRSQVNDLISKGPLYFWGAHICKPPLWGHEEKKCYDFGTVVHELLSSPSTIHDVMVEIPADALNADGHKKGTPWTDWKKSQAKADDNRIQLKAEEFAVAKYMIRRVYAHPTAAELLATVQYYEHTLVWQDPDTGLMLKSRTDLVSGIKNKIVLADTKSTRATTEEQFSYDMLDFGLHRQAAWYKRPWELLNFHVPAFVFLATGKNPPYSCRVHETDPDAIALGEQEITAGLRELKRRLEKHGDKPSTDDSEWLGPLDIESTMTDLPRKAYR